MADAEIGKITHYFPKVGVAVVQLSGYLKNGDMIKVVGKTAAFQQQVTSMQVEHAPVMQSGPGQSVGLKVVQPVHEGDKVYRMALEREKAII